MRLVCLLFLLSCARDVKIIKYTMEKPEEQFCFSVIAEYPTKSFSRMTGCTRSRILCERAYSLALTYGGFSGIRSASPCEYELIGVISGKTEAYDRTSDGQGNKLGQASR